MHGTNIEKARALKRDKWFEKEYDITDYASIDKLTKLYRDIIDYKNYIYPT